MAAHDGQHDAIQPHRAPSQNADHDRKEEALDDIEGFTHQINLAAQNAHRAAVAERDAELLEQQRVALAPDHVNLAEQAPIHPQTMSKTQVDAEAVAPLLPHRPDAIGEGSRKKIPSLRPR